MFACVYASRGNRLSLYVNVTMNYDEFNFIYVPPPPHRSALARIQRVERARGWWRWRIMCDTVYFIYTLIPRTHAGSRKNRATRVTMSLVSQQSWAPLHGKAKKP